MIAPLRFVIDSTHHREFDRSTVFFETRMLLDEDSRLLLPYSSFLAVVGLDSERRPTAVC